jgi:glycosyltransferase involved in cell wall biosynthesis
MGKLWIIMPVYNEAASVRDVVGEWMPMLRERIGSDFVFCALNDGSSDATSSILHSLEKEFPELKVVDKANSGHGQTCIEGYRLALKGGAEWIFQMDSDGQCSPSYFPFLWEARTSHPLVYGQRVHREDGYSRVVVSRITAWVTRWATGVWVKDPNVPYRLMRRDMLEAIVAKIPRTFHLANILVSVLHEKMLGIDWIPIHFRARTGGEAARGLRFFFRRGRQLHRQLREFVRSNGGLENISVPAAPANVIPLDDASKRRGAPRARRKTTAARASGTRRKSKRGRSPAPRHAKSSRSARRG